MPIVPVVQHEAKYAPPVIPISVSKTTPPKVNTKSSLANNPASPQSPSSLPLIQIPVGKPPISPPSSAPQYTWTPSTSAPRAPAHHTTPPAGFCSPLPSLASRMSQQSLGTPSRPDQPTPHELAARLALLLHARECCTPFDQERLCGVRNCRVARGILDHCQECFLPEGHCHRSCSESKHLLRHFRVCRAQQFSRPCKICEILRTDFSWALGHARSLTPLFVAEDQTRSPPQAHMPPQRAWPGGIVAPPVGLRRSVSDTPASSVPMTGQKRRASPPYAPVSSKLMKAHLGATPRTQVANTPVDSTRLK